MSEASSDVCMDNNESEFVLSESAENSKIENLTNSNRLFNYGRWTQEEHNLLIEDVLVNGIKNWKKLQEKIKSRNNCQIRSHFQKYLKKICSKYKLKKSLSEIYLEESKMSKISPKDMALINIFNDHSQKKRSFRKKKFAMKYKKGLEKKQLFRVKRSDVNEEKDVDEVEKILKNEENKEKNPNENNSDNENNEKYNFCSELMKIKDCNKLFIELIKNNVSYDLDVNLDFFENYLHTIAIFLINESNDSNDSIK